MDKDIVIPSAKASSSLQRQRRRMLNEKVFEEPNPSFSIAQPRRSLEALFSSTRHQGGISNSRITIPLPAVMSSITSITTGKILKDDKQNEDLPTLALDSEWFFLDSYPIELRPYLSTRYSFDVRPKTSEDILKITDTLLCNAYHNLQSVGLNIPIAPGLKDIFNELTKLDGNGRPRRRFGDTIETRNLYMILAYVLSVLLWKVGASHPARSYPEPTFPGVIVASFVSRLDVYYNDAMKKFGITAAPLTHKGSSPTMEAGINEIPILTTNMRALVEGSADLTNCDLVRDVALTLIPGLDKTRKESCQHYISLIMGSAPPPARR